MHLIFSFYERAMERRFTLRKTTVRLNEQYGENNLINAFYTKEHASILLYVYVYMRAWRVFAVCVYCMYV